ncbi:uncharacterized protein VTP21DRAFT_388 [Calcarisporiella thermophila]|uniref:uncharacterized protein n=1 Tax=Calcarisporiella thermophila TaxID=911321 RepID=UPI0037445017
MESIYMVEMIFSIRCDVIPCNTIYSRIDKVLWKNGVHSTHIYIVYKVNDGFPIVFVLGRDFSIYGLGLTATHVSIRLWANYLQHPQAQLPLVHLFGREGVKVSKVNPDLTAFYTHWQLEPHRLQGQVFCMVVISLVVTVESLKGGLLLED